MEQTTSSRLVYTGRVVNLRVDTVSLPDGSSTSREIVDHAGAVAIVAIDDEDNVVLVRQFRKAVEQHLLEIPAGTLTAGEDPAACARRELAEETGLGAGSLVPLIGFYTSPGFCTEYLQVYLACELTTGNPSPDADEQIEIVRMPLARCIEMIELGEICDAKTIVGLLSFSLSNRRDSDRRGAK